MIKILSNQEIKLEHSDKRFDGTKLSKIKFTCKQSQHKKAMHALFEQTNGMFVASTSFGKTVTGLAYIEKRKVNTLILVYNRQLANQSLVSLNGLDIKPAIAKYGQILIDECHHFPVSNYESLIKSVNAKFIHGLTATPKRQDGLENLMHF